MTKGPSIEFPDDPQDWQAGNNEYAKLAGVTPEDGNQTVADIEPESEQLRPDLIPTGIAIDRTNPTSAHIEQAIIENDGPIPYSEFMGRSLFGPDGYYSAAHARIRGQFITCPELSEEFNFALGEATLKVWEVMGKPGNFRVVEMGAGNGTLAKDMLVWARETQPDFYEALQYTIVEYGELIEKQRQTIGGSSRRLHSLSQASTPEQHNADLHKVEWLRGSAISSDLGEVEGVFLSNELPDAFPVEVIRTKNGKLQQKYITLENDEWVEAWSEPGEEVLEHVNSFGLTVVEGREEPVNLNAANWQHNLSRSLRRGAIITIDYGQEGSTGAQEAIRTFPQERGSEYRLPGRVDITSDVNFEALRRAAELDGLRVAFSDSQATFLFANGFPALEGLEAKMSEAELMGARRVLEDFGAACRTLVLTRDIAVDFGPA